MLISETALPMDEEAHFNFTKQSKNALYLNFESLLFKDDGGFSYPADHEFTPEFEQQMCELIREYLRDGEFLSVHHPPSPDGRDDAPDATALACFAAKEGRLREILFA